MKILTKSFVLSFIISLIALNSLNLNINLNALDFPTEKTLKTSPSIPLSIREGEQSQTTSKKFSSTSNGEIDTGQNGEQKQKKIDDLLNEATSSVKDNNIGKAISLLDEVLFYLENNLTDLKPFSNSSIESLVSNDATISGRPLKTLEELPPAQVVHSEVQLRGENAPDTIVLKTEIKPGFNPAKIYEVFDIPTYHAPTDVSKSFTYIPPTLKIVLESDEDNNKINEDYILATPIIDNIHTNMNILVDNSNSFVVNQSSLEQVRLIPIKNSSNVGFSIAVTDNIPDVLKISPPPVNELALFLETGIVSRTEKLSIHLNSDLIRDKSGTSNSSFVEEPSVLLPQFSILVSKSLNSSKLLDGCPEINFLYFNDTTASWNPAAKPLREMSMDTFNKCGFVLKPEHNSKFAVGGVQPLL